VLAGEIDVDDPAAHGEVAGHFDLIEAVVAMLGKPDDQFFRLERLASAGSRGLVELIEGGH
jgi:hypothetical protein